eukprot:4808880-Prymnesium_polylepis.1
MGAHFAKCHNGSDKMSEKLRGEIALGPHEKELTLQLLTKKQCAHHCSASCPALSAPLPKPVTHSVVSRH